MPTAKTLLLSSIAELNAHVATLPPTPDVNIWWTCPICKTENYGIRLGSYTPCAECNRYSHPPAGMIPKSLVEIQIEELEREIVALHDMADPLQDKLDMLYQEIDEKWMQIRVLKKERRW